VEIGQECVDHAGLDEEGGGFFNRFHKVCFGLMESFGDEFCGGGWRYPFDLAEGAEHALAHSDQPFWHEWLMQYEKTWAWTPEPPTPNLPIPRWRALTIQPTVVKLNKFEVKWSRPDVRVFREYN
jgi:hypothetical protein